MPLTKAERKERLGHGGIAKVARRTKRSHSHAAQVVRGERRDPRVEREVARRLELTVAEAFGPEYELSAR